MSYPSFRRKPESRFSLGANGMPTPDFAGVILFLPELRGKAARKLGCLRSADSRPPLDLPLMRFARGRELRMITLRRVHCL